MRFEPAIQVNPNPLGQVERFDDLLESLTWDERFHVPAPIPSISAPREAISATGGTIHTANGYTLLGITTGARSEAVATVDGLVATGNRVDPVSVVSKRPHGRPRKFPELAHLSPDDYRKEANRRHVAEYNAKLNANREIGRSTIEILGDESPAIYQWMLTRFSTADTKFAPLWEAFNAFKANSEAAATLADQLKALLLAANQKTLLSRKTLNEWIEHFQPKGPE